MKRLSRLAALLLTLAMLLSLVSIAHAEKLRLKIHLQARILN